jgi:site-specific DNA recombinase
MNVVIYARYSSHSQSEQSIEGQLQECYAYAKRSGYNVIKEYIDRALTGTTDNRPEFLRMIEDSNGKHFNGVLVYQLDRFARNRYDSATYKHRLKKNGVRVFSARENISDDASGVLMESMLEGMAEYYSAELSQKVKRGMSINASKYLYTGGVVPLGFTIDHEKRYQLDTSTAPVVVKIFQMYSDGSTMAEIATYLNSNQTKTSFGNDFNKNSLHRILLNTKYRGIYTYNGVESKDAIPRIINDRLFKKVQEMMAKNKQSPARSRAKAEYILTTKLFCGICKDMMVGVSGTSHTGSIHNYYRCKNTPSKKCSMKNIKKQLIENLVIDEARKVLTHQNIELIATSVVELAQKENNSGELRRLTKLLRDTEKQRLNLFNSLKICEVDSIKKSLFAEIANMDTQLQDLENQLLLEKATHVKLTKPQIKFFLTKIRSGDVDNEHYRKTLVNVLVDKVYLYADKLVIYFNVDGDPVTANRQTPSIEEVESSFIAPVGQPYLIAETKMLQIFRVFVFTELF